MQSIDKKIIARIRGNGKGWCFCPADFADLGDAPAVWTALHREAKRKAIRRLAQGLYDFPRSHRKLGLLAPDPEAVVAALTRRRGGKMQPSGAYAANLLGLSEQVPARIVYLTDGTPTKVKICGREIVFKQATPRTMAASGRISGTIIQALRFIGKERVTARHISMLRKKIAAVNKQRLLKDKECAPAWMRPLLAEIAGESVKRA